MEMFKSIKECVSFKVMKKGSFYTFLVLFMCLLLLTYQFIQDWMFERYLRPKIDPTLFDDVMALIPLVWISLVGLVISWVNTVVYCIFDVDGLNKKWKAFYIFSGILIIVGIVFICSRGYFEAKSLLTNGDRNNPEEMLKGIFNVFQPFTRGVAWLTIATFVLFLIIDLRDAIDCWLKRKKCNDKTIKERLLIEFRSSWLQLWLIDVTVLISSGMLWWFSGHIDYSYLSNEMVRGEFYTNVFMTGAWGIQIIYSQLVFYILTMHYYYEIIKFEH